VKLPPPRRLALRLALSTAALLLAVATAEFGLRQFAPQPISWLSIYAPDDVLPYRLAPGAQQRVETGETSWDVFVDAFGYRADGPDAAGRNEATYLLGLGDSFAFGHGCNQEQSLYGLLDRGLEGVRVRNAAVPGYGPTQYRQVLEHHLGQPGLVGVVVTSFLGNDFHDGIWNKDRPITDGALGATAGRRYWLKKTSHLYRFLSAQAHALGLGRGESDLQLSAELMSHAAWVDGRLAEAERIYQTELERIRDLCRENDLPLFVVLLPARTTTDDELLQAALQTAELAPEDWQRDLPTQKAAAVCARLGLPYFEAGELLRTLPPPVYFRFDGHFRPETTRVLAANLERQLAPGG